jgi:hypothetical protein
MSDHSLLLICINRRRFDGMILLLLLLYLLSLVLAEVVVDEVGEIVDASLLMSFFIFDGLEVEEDVDEDDVSGVLDCSLIVDPFAVVEENCRR